MAKRRSVYDADTVKAVMQVQDNIASFDVTVQEGMYQLAGSLLETVARHSMQITPVRKKPYPPSRKRTPGTMRNSIKIVKNTPSHIGWIEIDSWLWGWLDGVNASGRGNESDHHRNIKKGSKSLKRFKGMIKTDPRRLLGEPMQKQMSFIRSEKRMAKVLEKAVKKCEVKNTSSV